ncbi:MAG: exosortase K, partial [Synergistaceae bacterium]|nr:exosortase K [Synergistaceae bacterium]
MNSQKVWYRLSIRICAFSMYALCIMMCALSYVVLTRHIELSLTPHKIVMEYLFDFNFVFIEDVGYEQTNGLFIISRNCLGVKLFINLFIIMTFGFLHNYEGIKHKIAAVIKFYSLSLIYAFVIT